MKMIAIVENLMSNRALWLRNLFLIDLFAKCIIQFFNMFLCI